MLETRCTGGKTIRLVSLSSGSCGNSVYLEAGRTKLLVDAGVPLNYVGQALHGLGARPSELAAVLLTHDHSDHVQNAGPLSRRFRVPLMASAATLKAATGVLHGASLQQFSIGGTFAVGDFDVEAVPVAHDGQGTVGFVFHHAGSKVGVVTDLGCVTENVLDSLAGCDVLLFESNHDEDMLRQGRYPETLKRRIRGSFGHLSNKTAAAALVRLATGRPQKVLLAHLSAENNRPETALGTVAAALKRAGIDTMNLGVAERLKTSPVVSV